MSLYPACGIITALAIYMAIFDDILRPRKKLDHLFTASLAFSIARSLDIPNDRYAPRILTELVGPSQSPTTPPPILIVASVANSFLVIVDFVGFTFILVAEVH